MLLQRALYNLSDPCKKLVRIVESTEFEDLTRQHYNPPAPAAPSRRARRLSPTEDTQLAADYVSGAGSVYVLADKYRIHRNTVASLLKAQGLIIGKTPMNENEIAWARRLQAEGGSWNAIGAKLGRDPKTVKNTIG